MRLVLDPGAIRRLRLAQHAGQGRAGRLHRGRRRRAGQLAVLLRGGARFVGVMGSARHTAPHLEALRSLGCSEAEIGQVRTPVGLDLGGRTPAETQCSLPSEST